MTETLISSTRAQRSSSEAFDLFDRFSIELLPEQVLDFRPTGDLLPKGTEIFLTHILDKPLERQAEAARMLYSMGYEPVPHLAARNFASEQEFDSHIDALSGAGVKTVLLLGGNPDSPGRCFSCAQDLLHRPSLPDAGFARVYFAGHPEGHQVIPDDVLRRATKEKIAAARDLRLSPHLVTQFTFDGAVMADWAKTLRQDGIDVPIRFGMAGVTSLPKLIKFAMMCGVGASLTGLKRQGGSLLKAMRDQDPGDVVEALDEGLRRYGIADAHLHFFPFGGWERTASWIAKARRERLPRD